MYQINFWRKRCTRNALYELELCFDILSNHNIALHSAQSNVIERIRVWRDDWLMRFDWWMVKFRLTYTNAIDLIKFGFCSSMFFIADTSSGCKNRIANQLRWRVRREIFLWWIPHHLSNNMFWFVFKLGLILFESAVVQCNARALMKWSVFSDKRLTCIPSAVYRDATDVQASRRAEDVKQKRRRHSYEMDITKGYKIE